MKEENLIIVGKHLEAENKHDLHATLVTLHENCLFEDVALGKIYRGREAAGEYYQLWWNAFNLICKSEQRHWSEDGQTLVAEPRYIGKHIGKFYGIEPTHRDIDIKLSVIITFRDGLLNGERFYYDARTLLNQLGVNDFTSLN